jgi:hypothetical protein
MLQSYDWPGNVRELENVMERAVIMSNGGRLRVESSLLSSAIPVQELHTQLGAHEREVIGNMNFLIPSAKKTNPARSRTTSVAAGALVFSKLESVLSIDWCVDLDVFSGSHTFSQKRSTDYRANHDEDPGRYVPDLQTSKQDEGERQALR